MNRFLDFVKTNAYKLFLALTVIVFTFICAFGLGSVKGVCSYYQTGKSSSVFTYETNIYTIDLTENGVENGLKAKSVWLNIVGHDNLSAKSTFAVICGLALNELSDFRIYDELSVENGYKATVNNNGWYKVVDSSDTEFLEDAKNLLVSVEQDNENKVTVKIGEVVVLGENSAGQDVLIPLKSYASGFKSSLSSAISESTELDTSASAIKKADKLIDEQSKFDVSRVDKVYGYYNADGRITLTQSEYHALESIRSIFDGNADTVDGNLNPLGSYILSLGVIIFGGTTLGLRIIPFLFSIGSLIMIYCLCLLVFKKESYGLLASFLLAVCGYSTSFAVLGRVDAIMVFLCLASLYFILRFYRKGIADKHKFKGYMNVFLSGMFFGLALLVKSQSLFVLPALLLIAVFGFIRQYNAYRARKYSLKTGSKEYSENKKKYIKKFSFTLMCSVIGFIILPIALLLLFFLFNAGYYLTAYNTGNTIFAMGSHFVTSLTCFYESGYAYVDAVSPLGWIVNYTPEIVGSNQYVFGNMITVFANIFCLIYALFYIILSLTDKKVEIKPEKKFGIIYPIIFFLTGYLSSWLLSLIGGKLPMGGAYMQSVFAVLICVCVVYATHYEENNILFEIKGLKIKTATLITVTVGLIALIAYLLAIPAFIGSQANISQFSWNVIKFFQVK